MRALILSLLILISGHVAAQVYEAPLLHCLQVDPVNGDVTLTWQPVANSSGTFESYKVIRKDQFSDTEVVSINAIGTTSTIDVDASFLETEVYYVKAIYNSFGTTVEKDGNCLKTLNPTGTAFSTYLDLYWPRPTNGPDSLMYTQFQVQMNYTGTWQTISSQSYADSTIVYYSEVCPEPPAIDVDIDFRVVLTDVFGCASISIVSEDNLLKDETVPTPPVIETVTFDTLLQRPVICWNRPPEGDVGGYIIQYLDAVDAGYVNDPDVLSFIDPDLGSNFLLNSVGYVVLAYDTCAANATTALDSEPHYTIHLELEYLKCEQNTALEWNPYINWEGGVEHYIVYGGLFGGPLTALDTLPPTQTAYVDEGVPSYVDLTYMIKAVSVNGYKPSLSLKQQLTTVYPETPNFTYLANVSVTGAKQVELKALVEPAAEGTRYRFEKLNRFGDGYDPLGTLPESAKDLDGFISWYDNEAFPSSTIHEYQVVSIDSCGNDHAISQTSSNILATMEIDDAARINTISWEPYTLWEGGVLAYNVYQVNNGVVGNLLATLPEYELSFTHTVDSLFHYERDAQYCYLIEAIEGLQFLGIPQVSHSNIICGTQEPLMFIPNVFTPNGDGLNDTFGPVAGYFDRTQGYMMTIYDRWGHVVWETDNYYKTWDAQDGDGFVQEGVYVYSIRFRTGGGELYQRNGTVTVLLAATE